MEHESGGHAVVASLDQLIRMLRRVMPPDDLSLTAASTLRRLEDGGAQRLTELACLEGITQPAMTQLVSRLEKDRLAERVKDLSDGRAVLIRITPNGREALRVRRAARARSLDQLLRALPAEDRDVIMAALPALEKLAKIGTPAS